MIQETKTCPECELCDDARVGKYGWIKPFCGTCGRQIHRIKISSDDIYEVRPTWDFSTTNGIHVEIDRIEAERPEWSKDIHIYALLFSDDGFDPERIVFSGKRGMHIYVYASKQQSVFFVRDYGRTSIFSSMDVLLLHYELDDNCEKKDSEVEK